MINQTFIKKWQKYGLSLDYLKKLEKQVHSIKTLSKTWQKQLTTLAKLQKKHLELKKLACDDSFSKEKLCLQASALVDVVCCFKKNSAIKILGKETQWQIALYEVQHFAAQALVHQDIVEQATGEGKTYSLMVAAYIQSLLYSQVHIITVNDYLACRDYEIYRFILEPLGVTCGLNNNRLDWSEKQVLYQKDILFGTIHEFGFDYLRNHQVRVPSRLLNHRQDCALVDEVDGVLIDEAVLPMVLGKFSLKKNNFSSVTSLVEEIISLQQQVICDLFKEVRQLLKTNNFSSKLLYFIFIIQKGSPKNKDLYKLLTEHPQLVQNYRDKYPTLWKRCKSSKELFFYIDQEKMTVYLTEKGLDWYEQALGYNPYEVCSDLEKTEKQRRKAREIIYLFDRLLFANVLIEKDSEYIVTKEDILLIDPLYGCPQPKKELRFGLHNAIRAKEQFSAFTEEIICGQISIKNYMEKYSFCSGITGVAFPALSEFEKSYHKKIAPVPLYRKEMRHDYPVLCFADRNTKIKKLFSLIDQAQKVQRPVLIGVKEIKESEEIAQFLATQGYKIQLLNAKNLHMAHQIFSLAGKPQAITIATNVAGRGADIVVDSKTIESIAANYIKLTNITLKVYTSLEKDILLRSGSKYGIALQCKKNKDFWEITCGNDKGPYVDVCLGLESIIVEFMEEKRVEEQFRRRSARQGNPGSSRTIVCLEDALIRLNPFLIPNTKLEEKHIFSWQRNFFHRNMHLRAFFHYFDQVYENLCLSLYSLRQEILCQGKLPKSITIEEERAKALKLRENLWQKEWKQILRNIALPQLDHFAENFIEETETLKFSCVYHDNSKEHYSSELCKFFHKEQKKAISIIVETLINYPLPKKKAKMGSEPGFSSRALLRMIKDEQ